jgi:uncharacterized protein (TIGR00725 family)
MELTGPRIAVIGSGACDETCRHLAYETGRQIGRRGVLLCGGRGGVMAAAAAGARSVGGLTVGILPGGDASETPPNAHIQLPIFTGLGQARNQVIVLSAQAIVAVCGGWGTLNEISIAAKHGIPTACLNSWRLEPPPGVPAALLMTAETPAEAVRVALAAAGIDEESR